jgi:hypothetical protein
MKYEVLQITGYRVSYWTGKNVQDFVMNMKETEWSTYKLKHNSALSSLKFSTGIQLLLSDTLNSLETVSHELSGTAKPWS